MQARYRDALLRAAFDLQSRLYNILNGFLQSYHGRSERHRSYAEDSTIWLIGQYLGWVEAMRRDAEFLDLGSVRSARRLELALGRVRDAFGSDRKISDPLLLIFRVDQRALGELMLAEEKQGGADSLHRLHGIPGPARGCRSSPRFAPLRDDVRKLVDATEPERAADIQQALID